MYHRQKYEINMMLKDVMVPAPTDVPLAITGA